MKKVFFSAAMSLLLLAGFSSCKNDDPEPPKPPVVEDVLGSYSAENLALTVTGGTPGAGGRVAAKRWQNQGTPDKCGAE